MGRPKKIIERPEKIIEQPEKKTEEKTEVFTQNGKPYKMVTWKNGVANIEYL